MAHRVSRAAQGSTTDCIVLAGGRGTRLASVVSDRPKALAMVAGRPFLDWLLEYLCEQPIARVVLSVGYQAEQISARYGARFDRLAIAYAREEEALGTGGGIRYAMGVAGCTHAFALNGDTFAPVPLALLEGSARDDIVVALRAVEDASRYGSVRCEGDRIIAFGEKRERGPALVNAGAYWLRDRVFTGHAARKPLSLEQDVLENGIGAIAARGVVIDVPFVDIGTPEALAEAQHTLPGLRQRKSLD